MARKNGTELPLLSRPAVAGEPFEYLWMGLHEKVPGWAFALGVTGDEVVSFSMAAWPPTKGRTLSWRQLREAPFGELRAAAVAEARAARGEGEHAGPPARVAERYEDWLGEARKRYGSRGRSDYFYAKIAADYEVLTAGTKPVARLAAARNLSASQVRNLLYEARRRGLLSPTRRGVASGGLTEHGRDVLAQGTEAKP